MTKLYKNYEWLIQKYVEEKLTMQQIAKICGCRKSTIYNWMKKYDVPRRTHSESNKGKKRPDMIGENNPMWNGGKRRINGYTYIYSPDHPFRNKDGSVAQHRLVAEKSLRKYFPNHSALIEVNGEKYLRKDWITHHNDGIKDNNIWSNLSAMPKPSHDRFHSGRQLSEETKRKMSNTTKQQHRDQLGRFTKGNKK